MTSSTRSRGVISRLQALVARRPGPGRALAALVLLAALYTVAAPAGAQQPAAAGDAKRGARIAYTCYGCHGIPDYRNAYPAYRVPKIGGQHEAYIVAALTEYRAGARPHPTMRGQAASMSDQDIRDIAAYFAAIDPVKCPGEACTPVGKAPDVVQTCAACHGPTGVSILPEYPVLSGQHHDYLEQALHAYRKGTRQNAIMQGFAAALKDEDIAAVAAYFSQQRPALSVPRAPSQPAK